MACSGEITTDRRTTDADRLNGPRAAGHNCPKRPVHSYSPTPKAPAASDELPKTARVSQPSMRWVLQNEVRLTVVAACAAALNSATVETPNQWEAA